MLCPEVWNFSAPPSIFKAEKSNLKENKCLEDIEKFHYSHLVSVTIPDIQVVTDPLKNILKEDCEYYKIEALSIEELINPDFIHNFIKKGYFIGLSINRRIDCDDCICVTPNGLIVLSLTKDSFQTLGLDGKVSQFCKNTKSRYIVQLDLMQECLRPKKKNYIRTKSCLSRLKPVTLIVNWEPYESNVCPSSVAKYFHDLNYVVKTCETEFTEKTNNLVRQPNLNVDNAWEIAEWIGVNALQAQTQSSKECDEYLSNYTTPEPYTKYGQAKILQWRGLFSPKQIRRVYELLKVYVEDRSEYYWVSMYVQGFSDAPISWGLRENHYFSNGDNSYVVALNTMQCLVCKHMCSLKYYK